MCKMCISQVYPLYDNRFSIYLVLVHIRPPVAKIEFSPSTDSKQGLIDEDLKIGK